MIGRSSSIHIMGAMQTNLEPKKILVVLHGSIGDVTRALPLANLLHRGFPKATLAWAVEPPSLPLVEHHPAVDEVILFDRPRWWNQLGPFLRRIRAGRFDLVLDLQRHLKSGIISRWSGAPHRLGFHRLDCKEFNWVFNNHHIPAVENGISKFNHYLKFAEYLGLAPEPVEWKLSLTKEERVGVDRRLANVRGAFATLFVGSRWESKDGSRRKYRLAQTLCGHVMVLALFCWAANRTRPSQGKSRLLADQGVTNLVGRTSLKEAVGSSRGEGRSGTRHRFDAHCCGGGYTGHILMGATSPSRTGPYGFEDLVIQGKADCSPCYRRHCPIGRVCMQSIEVETIMAKIEIGLSRERNGAAAYETQL